MLTSDQAYAELLANPSKYSNQLALTELVGRLSVTPPNLVPNSVSVLFSGPFSTVGGTGTGTVALSSTPIADFLGRQNAPVVGNATISMIANTEAYKFLIDGRLREFYIEQNKIGSLESFNEWIGGRADSTGGWGKVSQNFVANLRGAVVTLTPYADQSRIFGVTELAEILKNPEITSVNGISRSVLLQVGAEAVRAGATDGGYSGIFDVMKLSSRQFLEGASAVYSASGVGS
jgi:hypothetical protein